MRILVVYPYIPYPVNRGAYHRAFQLLREMAQRHEVDLLALAERGEGMEHRGVFSAFCRRVEFVSFEHPAWAKLFPKRLLNPLPSTIAHWSVPEVREKLRRMLDGERYQAVHICDIVLAPYFLRENRSWPLVVDRTRVDLYYQWMEYRRMQPSLRGRLLHWESFAKLWMFEKAVARRAEFQVVCGPDDEKVLRRFVRRDAKVAVIPNGVDADYFYPEAAPGTERAAEPTVLFCGAMDYNPNIDALRWYFNDMHAALRSRVPDLRVLIVGKDPAAEVRRHGMQPGVTVTGGVPDVRPYYRQAWLQIVPLRIGGGTRLKIVESMAMKTPVVSTTIGAQGLELRNERDILLADTAETFVRETARALKQPGLRHDLEETGFATVRGRLSWPMLGAQLNRVYADHFSRTRIGEPAAALV